MSWNHFPKSAPRKVDGGIKARSKRGEIGEKWWSRRFVEVVESYSISSRIKRGKRYARGGQVLAIDVQEDAATARVQGSRATPYEVEISGASLNEADWQRVESALAERAVFAAQLLAGEMPADIEEAFEACEFSLFPSSYEEMQTHCNCPDYANPCKHIAAVFYILAEKFDEDPFLIFRWRGRSRDALLAELRRRRSVENKPATQHESLIDPAPPLGEYLDDFWSAGKEFSQVRTHLTHAEIPDAALRPLGAPPARIGEVYEALTALYQVIAGHEQG